MRQAGTQTYQYDANGNMSNRAGDTLHYDVENRLTQVVTGGGVTTDYVYNGDGVRVKKVANGISTFYIGGSYVVSVNGQVTTASKYYSFGGLRVAVKFGSTLYYLHVDHLGSTSVATDTSGNPISKQTYLAFGAVRTSEGTSPTDYGFTGQRFDASSALMYYGARYYDPVLGRFTQADPIVPSPAPQSLNRYAYVTNNPVNFVDPLGYDEEPPCQPWDNWCWENRYWTAHGKCYNAGKDEWTRECAPTFSDPDILMETVLDFPSILMRLDAQFLGPQSGFIRGLFVLLGRIYESSGNAVFVSLIAAYEAVGEANNCKGQECVTTFAAIIFTVLNRFERCQQPACGVNIDKPMTESSILLTGCAGGFCSEYQGLEHFISGSKDCCFDTSDPTTVAHLNTAFAVALDIFTGAYKSNREFTDIFAALAGRTHFGSGDKPTDPKGPQNAQIFDFAPQFWFAYPPPLAP